MSYDIIYDRGYAKTENEMIIPLILIGSSNLYETGASGVERRARNWDVSFFLYNKPFYSPDELSKTIDERIEKLIKDSIGNFGNSREEVEKKFCYHMGIYMSGRNIISAKQFSNYLKNGIKNAIPINELEAYGVSPVMHLDTNAETDFPESCTYENAKQWERMFYLYKKEYEKKGGYTEISFNNDSDYVSKILKQIRGSHRKKKVCKVEEQQDYHYILYNESEGRYFIRYVAHGFKYSVYQGAAKRFKTEKDISRYLKKIKKEGKYYADMWQIKKVG